MNVQAIVGKIKLALSHDMACLGAVYDSMTFKNSNLYAKLKQNWLWMKDRGLYYICDSAYSLKLFLVTPFDNTIHGIAKDVFNFSHLSAQIVILWKSLSF